MSKYDPIISSVDAESLLAKNEKILWRGKPKKSAFVLNKAIVMLPIAIIWLLFDSPFIYTFFSTNLFVEAPGMAAFMVIFFAFHLAPVWIWLSNVISANRRWRNTEYIATDKRIMIATGFLGIDHQTLYYKDIKNVKLHIGVIDRILGVGDIHFETDAAISAEVAKSTGASFIDIENVTEAYSALQKIVLDIQTDIAYPNDLRPGQNHGYDTEYVNDKPEK